MIVFDPIILLILHTITIGFGSGQAATLHTVDYLNSSCGYKSRGSHVS
jgi:hypothetical protein